MTMKRVSILVLILAVPMLLILSCKSQKEVENKKVELKNAADSAAYAIGMQIANNLMQQSLDTVFNPEMIAVGLKDQMKKQSVFKIEETDKLIQDFFNEFQKSKSKDKIAEGEKFLKENSKRQGVITIESGLQYEIIKQGTGPKPTINNTVKTHYKGTLIDGTVFDSSYDRGEPISFPLSGVIKGWTEGLQLMPVGSKYKFYIPYYLAYGERGAGQIIGPYETLIFEVELLSIEK